MVLPAEEMLVPVDMRAAGQEYENVKEMVVKLGVRGAAVRHIRVSDSAMLQTNKLMPVWRLGVLGKTTNRC